MAKKAATFTEFLAKGADVGREAASCTVSVPPAEPSVAPSSKKVKVGLTISTDVVEAVRDYIYQQGKAGRKIKINDVYESAVRSYLGIY